MYEPSPSQHLDDHEPTPDRGERSLYLGLAVVFALIGAALAFDLFDDLAHGTTLRHALMEACVVFVSFAGVLTLALRLRALRRRATELRVEAQALRQRVAISEQDAQRFREEAAALLRGLGAAIDRQFERWQLSAAEREVALLLLKGLSHKEIAHARATAEPTVRQQAQAVYRKAGVTGRADLAAFFLEDLLLPSAPAS